MEWSVSIAAKTPIYYHLIRAVEEMEKAGGPGFSIDIPNSVSDQEVADRVARGDITENGEQIIVGACDPKIASQKGLRICGALVKRLGFVFVCREDDDFSGMVRQRQCVKILAHGAKESDADPSTAVRLARFLSETYFCYTNGEHAEVEIVDYDNLKLEKGCIAITANLWLANALRLSQVVSVIPVDEVFPELSRFFLTALVASLDSFSYERGAAIKDIVEYVQKVGKDIRFLDGKPGIGPESYFFRQFEDAFAPSSLEDNMEFYSKPVGPEIVNKSADYVYKYLKQKRIIPSNLEVCSWSTAITEYLWSNRNDEFSISLFSPEERSGLIGKDFPGRYGNSIQLATAPQIAGNARKKYHAFSLKELNKPIYGIARQTKVLVLTALEEEFEAFRDVLKTDTRDVSGIRNIESCADDALMFLLRADGGGPRESSRTIVLASLGGPGRVNAALKTAKLLKELQPDFVILAGIAAGITNQNLDEPEIIFGDILIPNVIVDYEPQKIRNSPRSEDALDYDVDFRHPIMELERRLIREAKDMSKHHLWDWNITTTRFPEFCKESVKWKWKGRDRPKCHANEKLEFCLFSGDKVIAADGYLDKAKGRYPFHIGVEMESSGVAAALNEDDRRIQFLVVKAVSDFADDDKSSTVPYREYALKSSAAFAIELLKRPDFL